MNIPDILQDQAGRVAVFILIYLGITVLIILTIWFGYKILGPIFRRSTSEREGDDLRFFIRDIANAAKEMKPKEATWSEIEITPQRASIVFGTEGGPRTVEEKNKHIARTVNPTIQSKGPS